jgi:hypothetical protein
VYATFCSSTLLTYKCRLIRLYSLPGFLPTLSTSLNRKFDNAGTEENDSDYEYDSDTSNYGTDEEGYENDSGPSKMKVEMEHLAVPAPDLFRTVAAKLQMENLQNFSEVDDIATLLAAGGASMKEACEKFVQDFFDPWVVSFECCAISDSANQYHETKDVVYVHEMRGTLTDFETVFSHLDPDKDSKLVNCLKMFLERNQDCHDELILFRYFGETSRTAQKRFKDYMNVWLRCAGLPTNLLLCVVRQHRWEC